MSPNARDVSLIDSVAAGVGVPAGEHHGGNRHSHPAAIKPIAAGKSIGFIMPPKDADAPDTRYAAPIRFQQDAPSCSDCDSIMVRNGACYTCLNCG